MLEWLLTIRIDQRSFLIPLDVLAALLFLTLLLRRPLRSAAVSCGFAALGAAVGLLTAWLVSDVFDVFGVPLTMIVRLWATLACAGLFLAASNLWASRWWRKVVAIFAGATIVITSAAGINVDFGAYRDLDDAFAISSFAPLTVAQLSGQEAPMDPNLAATWQPPADLPSSGAVGTVSIPATQSHFPAREATVYLPPAALVATPPVLPVLMMFSGQPGSPADVFTSGQISHTLDAFAAAHGGLAPIVVVPDQLGAPLQNPMCADSVLGNAATYLTVDVPTWIRTHLHVASSPRYWAVGGYSQGGTCAIQFGAGHPELFGSIIDILGELEPTAGADTANKAFGGSQAAYDAVKPLTLLTRNAPFADSLAIFGEGSTDQKFSAFGRQVKAAAESAGMSTKLILSPDSGHDWNTVRFVFSRALDELGTRWGLG